MWRVVLEIYIWFTGLMKTNHMACLVEKLRDLRICNYPSAQVPRGLHKCGACIRKNPDVFVTQHNFIEDDCR